MATNEFSKSEAIKFGWNTMKANFGFFIGIMVVFIVGIVGQNIILGWVRGLIEKSLNEEMLVIVRAVFWTVSVLLTLGLQMGLFKIAIKFVDSEKPKLSDLFSCFHLVFKLFFAEVIGGLIWVIGLILLIIPGIIWMTRIIFFRYLIVDKEVGPIEALKGSFRMTRGAAWNLFLLILLLLCINLLGLICLVIGLFVTIPITVVSYAFVYRKLEKQLKTPEVPITPMQS